MDDSDVRDVLNDIGRALGIYDDDNQEQEPCGIETVLDAIVQMRFENQKAAIALGGVAAQSEERSKEIAQLKATAREYFEAKEAHTLAILYVPLPGYAVPSKDEAAKRYGEAIKAMQRMAGYEVVNGKRERER